VGDGGVTHPQRHEHAVPEQLAKLATRAPGEGVPEQPETEARVAAHATTKARLSRGAATDERAVNALIDRRPRIVAAQPGENREFPRQHAPWGIGQAAAMRRELLQGRLAGAPRDRIRPRQVAGERIGEGELAAHAHVGEQDTGERLRQGPDLEQGVLVGPPRPPRRPARNDPFATNDHTDHDHTPTPPAMRNNPILDVQTHPADATSGVQPG
jgi:hypothetical protein